ncbi:hypothetical protein [Halorarum salinum]|uniref:CHAT domain-containing protein n=1 Tax=Halorarum salinum TaxID=2743089 RepID=A0A7D5LDQ1_9EURY|nr:hypothetical protein [Halobaculum salinum]QLG64292.1 hypothetical protein HUG12_21160 [Halobaculum salinum]
MDAMGIGRTPDGLELVDNVRSESVLVGLPSDATVAPGTPDVGTLPVERAVRVHTDRVSLPGEVLICVREADYSFVDRFDFDVDATLPRDAYVIEVDADLKVYLTATASLDLVTVDGRTEVTFDGSTALTVGGRARRREPHETLRTTTDGPDLLRAIEWLGAPFVTGSPERAWPTLRGHPPSVELGDSFRPPDGLSLPDTGLRLTLPPTPEYAFPAAPLAAYLGARTVPGESPLLSVVDESDPLVEFPTGAGYADAVTDLLARTFLLDCVVRTEGIYPIELSLRRRFEGAAPDALDPADLYERPLAERVRAYVDVPDEAVEAVTPPWPTCAHVEPDPEHVTALPAFVDELAAVRVGSPERVGGEAARPVALNAFLEDGQATTPGSPAAPAAGESTRSAAEVFAEEETFALVPPADAGNVVYVGDGIPIGADTFLREGAVHRHARRPRAGPLSVLLVANDPAMAPEVEQVEAVYGRDSSADLAVWTATDLTRTELADRLAETVDLLHFVGHATPEGLECADGTLDVASLEEHGVGAFVLNACQSYRQGVRLVEDGAVAGAVALSDVENGDAVDVGLLLARLLNDGFPFGAAMRLARSLSVVGGQYTVVGDGRFTLTQRDGGVPIVVDVRRAGDDEYGVRIRPFRSPEYGIGSITTLDLAGVPECFVNVGETPEFALDADALESFLDLQPVLVEYEGELRWNTELSLPHR